MLSNAKIPTLVLHGGEDDLAPLQDSRDALKYLPKGSRLEIVEEAGHGFGGYLVEEWLLDKFY